MTARFRTLRTGRLKAGSRLFRGAAVLVAIGLLASACGSADSEEAGSADSGKSKESTAQDPAAAKLLPSEIRSSGEVQVASTISYPPFQFYKKDGKTPQGSSIDLAQALGEQLGVDFVFHNVSFDAILPGIASGRYDIALTGMSVTPERAKQVNFVTTLQTGSSILIKADNPKEIHSLKDLCGLPVAVVKGTNHGANLRAFNKSGGCESAGEPINVDYYEAPGALAALDAGRAVARYTDFGGNAYAAKKSNGQLKVVGDLHPLAPFGIAIAKQNTALAKAIKKALNDLIASGEYVDILKKSGLEQGALEHSKLVTGDS